MRKKKSLLAVVVSNISACALRDERLAVDAGGVGNEEGLVTLDSDRPSAQFQLASFQENKVYFSSALLISVNQN